MPLRRHCHVCATRRCFQRHYADSAASSLLRYDFLLIMPRHYADTDITLLPPCYYARLLYIIIISRWHVMKAFRALRYAVLRCFVIFQLFHFRHTAI